MNSYSIPDDPRFAALHTEAATFLHPAGFKPGEARQASRHIVVTAGNADSEAYTITRNGQRLTIRGDGSRGAAHGFHHALRLMGYGFSFFSDAIPRQPRLRWPVRGDVLRREPAFATRGFLPWGNLLNSTNVWNLEDYRQYLLTMWRWGSNLLWLHNYDMEPLAAFREERGKWSHGKPYMDSFHPPCGAVQGIRVQDFPHGTAKYFPDARNGVWAARHGFSRDPIGAAQAEFREVVAFAKSLGIDTAFGFQTDGDPGAPGYRQLLARRIRHILETYPDLHTLCLWESEGPGQRGWPYANGSPDYPKFHRQYARHFKYLAHVPNRLAEAVRLATLFNWSYTIAKEIRPAIKVAFSGWGGDAWLRWGDYWRGLHACLPDDVVLAQLDNLVPQWQDGVSKSIQTIPKRRKAWTTIWVETDGGPLGFSSMWHPQEDLGHWEKLVKSANRLGYQGLLVQHWNTAGIDSSAAYVAAASWNAPLTATEFRRDYSATFFGTPRAATILEQLEGLGAGWTGTSQHTECDAFNWDSFDPRSPTGKLTPTLERLGRLLPRARRDYFEVENLSYGASFRMNGLLFHFGTQAGRRDAFENLLRLRGEFVRLGLRTPHARRLLATMDFVIAYERIKRQLDARGPLAAQQGLILQARKAGLKPDPRLLARYRRGVAAVEGLWKQALRAQANRLDTRSDLGTLATINVKAYPAWQKFIAAGK